MCRRIDGFTIVELVTVIILLAVLSTVALSRSVSTSAFSPGTVSLQLNQELRLAQASAQSRQDAQITFQIDLNGNAWRMLTTSDVDGTMRSVDVDQENTDIQATSGATSATFADGGALIVQFDSLGDLSSVTIEGTSADPDEGVAIQITGDSMRELCVYPTGYVANDTCA